MDSLLYFKVFCQLQDYAMTPSFKVFSSFVVTGPRSWVFVCEYPLLRYSVRAYFYMKISPVAKPRGILVGFGEAYEVGLHRTRSLKRVSV